MRFPLQLPVAVRTSQTEHEAETSNISAGGVLFYTKCELATNSTIEFTIYMPGAILGSPKDILVNCSGRVVRCTPCDDRWAVAAIIDEYRFER